MENVHCLVMNVAMSEKKLRLNIYNITRIYHLSFILITFK